MAMNDVNSHLNKLTYTWVILKLHFIENTERISLKILKINVYVTLTRIEFVGWNKIGHNYVIFKIFSLEYDEEKRHLDDVYDLFEYPVLFLNIREFECNLEA